MGPWVVCYRNELLNRIAPPNIHIEQQLFHFQVYVYIRNCIWLNSELRNERRDMYAALKLNAIQR